MFYSKSAIKSMNENESGESKRNAYDAEGIHYPLCSTILIT